MAVRFTIFASDDRERHALEQALLGAAGGVLAGPALSFRHPFSASPALLQQVRAQAADALLVALPEGGAQDREPAYALIAWLRTHAPEAAIMALGPMQEPGAIVAAMRAGAGEYLERPLRPEALEEAVQRITGARQALVRQSTRGQLLVVLGARGGCGATTVAVNLALALQGEQRKEEAPVLLLDAAPLGHAALHLNLKPQYTVADLLDHSARLDGALLQTLLNKHASGVELLAGPAAPLGTTGSAEQHAAWLELLCSQRGLVVADVSSRIDGLTQALLARADRILFISQPDMVSLWSAAKVRQYLDPDGRWQFEMIVNRYTAATSVDLGAVASITRSQVLWKLPNAYAAVMESIERGQPVMAGRKGDLARSYRELAVHLLGRPAPRRSWLPFLRLRAAQG